MINKTTRMIEVKAVRLPEDSTVEKMKKEIGYTNKTKTNFRLECCGLILTELYFMAVILTTDHVWKMSNIQQNMRETVGYSYDRPFITSNYNFGLRFFYMSCTSLLIFVISFTNKIACRYLLFYMTLYFYLTMKLLLNILHIWHCLRLLDIDPQQIIKIVGIGFLIVTFKLILNYRLLKFYHLQTRYLYFLKIVRPHDYQNY
ncbi:uncharacterized protein LOC119686290 [Teleopsis dalmanni]|uniref:uncharacterized protein LOC119686290 n=1 Tax=Teleopsis dalmanni TaxID=139649 RepID=UPI0018CDEB1D|nr:uncharacterized protein LOC119686290 [Teleopsis dalmanni]XP_037956771.1 uncharacterized protein LOC119686290 [Teleopsis dalmanni]